VSLDLRRPSRARPSIWAAIPPWRVLNLPSGSGTNAWMSAMPFMPPLAEIETAASRQAWSATDRRLWPIGARKHFS